MRISTGKWKGKKIFPTNSKVTRPTKSIVKEAIFNCFDFQDAVVLDLFARSGAVSFEMLSQGAKFCYMCDNNIDAFKSIKMTAKNIGCVDLISVFFCKADIAIKKLIRKNILLDVIYIDPPYDMDIVSANVIEKCIPICKNGTYVLVEYGKKVVFPKFFKDLTTKSYGNTVLNYAYYCP